jgi:hypothetical protein
MGTIQGYGLSVDLPGGWAGRIFRASDPEEDDGRPTMHVGNFAIAADESTFGSSIMGAMSAGGQIFMALSEYTPDCLLPNTGTPIPDDPASVDLAQLGALAFGNPGVPVLQVPDFFGDVVHGTTSLRTATAVQVPFTTAGRLFVLNAVVGDQGNLASAVTSMNDVLSTVLVSPAIVCSFELTLHTEVMSFNSPLDLGNPRNNGGSITGEGTATCVLMRGLDRTVSEHQSATVAFSGTWSTDTIVDPVNIDGHLVVTLNGGLGADPTHGRLASVTGTFPVDWTLVMPNFVTPTVAAQGPQGDPILLPALVTQPSATSNRTVVKGSFVAPAADLNQSILLPVDTPTVTASNRMAIPVVWRGPRPADGAVSVAAYPRGTGDARPQRVQIAHGSFSAKPGQRRVVKMRLTRQGRSLLARRHPLRAEVTAIVESGKRRVRADKTVLLRRARRR